ncbi:DUF3598 family protein [Geitlerinema splendidum]|nr:DUF3598 family protein [Geitlerinema splendidum]
MIENLSQWDCLLKNLGAWEGSFTRFSPAGELIEDTPSIVTLEGLNQNQTIRQTITRFPRDRDKQESVLEYSSLGRGVLFCSTGAFSQGSTQWGPFSEFGAELGLIADNRRLRLVQLYNREAQLDRLTLIRETRQGTQPAPSPELTVDQLKGVWQGEAVTVYPDWRSPLSYPTHLRLQQLDSHRLVQQLSFGETTLTSITSTATIEPHRLLFEQSEPKLQVLFLPNGVSSTCPLSIQPGQPFFLEVGWLISADSRQRLIRHYNEKGEWVSLTLVTEYRSKNRATAL